MEQFAHAQHGAKPEKLHVLKMEHAADMGLRRPYRPQFFNLVLQIKSLITSNAEPLGVNMRLWFESRTDSIGGDGVDAGAGRPVVAGQIFRPTLSQCTL